MKKMGGNDKGERFDFFAFVMQVHFGRKKGRKGER